ncbi:hypothetical protein niasHT_039674 [Heterodera trifolii]|uniref:EB domain-containing protein n=1 Tax=Heterodera trifolii TaxID=157864 RepID=A0ABD2I921_9BILA
MSYLFGLDPRTLGRIRASVASVRTAAVFGRAVHLPIGGIRRRNAWNDGVRHGRRTRHIWGARDGCRILFTVLPYGYGGYSFGSSIGHPSGLLPCSLMQDCPNGQICVSGFCSESNVAFGGSQMFKTPPNCASGALCPLGYFCMGGICAKDLLSQTSTCSFGLHCPPGQMCQFGRCLPSMGALAYGKKR